MIGFISFLIVIAGSVNWLLIGMLQYDFVAGWFGYQASIFSRLIYILVGIAGLVLLFLAFKDKGKINIINFRFLKKRKESKERKKATANNIEAHKEPNYEDIPQEKHQISGRDYSDQDRPIYHEEKRTNSIFDEENK